MATTQDPRLEAYQQQIGWDQLKEPGSPLGGVAAVWPDMTAAPALQGGAWKVIADDIHFTDNVVEREWILRQQRETVTVRVAVASDGWDGARRHFLASVGTTTMMQIPYRKAAQPLGALAVELDTPLSKALIWLFRNVCFQVATDETSLAPRPLASWLQAQAAAAWVEDLAPHRPQLERLELSSHKVAAGATLTAKLWLAASAPPPERHLFSFQADRAKLDLLEERGDNVRYKALAAGSTRVVARVADRQTLLAGEMGADVAVQ